MSELETLTEKSEVELELEKLIAPLRKLDEELGQKEAELSIALQGLRAERLRVKATLRSILPPVPKEKKEPIYYGNQNVTISTEKVELVRKVVAPLEGEWGTADVRKQLPNIPNDTIRKALVRLRESNEVRVTSMRRGRGGGMVFVTTPKGKAELNGDAS